MPATIRIMHVVDSLGKGGLENGLANLIGRLEPHFEHVVCAMRGLGPNVDRLPSDRVSVTCLAKDDSGSTVQIGALAREIRKVRPDIVHSRNWSAVEAVMAGKLAGSCRVVHSEHGLDSDTAARESWRRRAFRRLAFELADRVVSVSYQLRDLHARRTRFAARKIVVIHNGVDHRRFGPDAEARARIRAELSIAPDDFCIGSVGNLLPVKDHLTLLRAFDAAAGERRKWRLLLLGEGPERPKLEAFADAHPGWRDKVSFLGSSNRVAQMLNAMDVYVLPSITEGISNSLLEAMATGLPVIVTDTGGNPEVVIEGDSGLLFPVGDSRLLSERLCELSAKGDRRIQLGQRALRRVTESFSIDSMARNYAQLYESLMPVALSSVRAPAGV